MAILIHDTLATQPWLVPLRSGWLPGGDRVTAMERLTATQVGPGDIALLPSPELLPLLESHVLVPEVGVVADGSGPYALRTPIRPDGIEGTVIRLYETSSTAGFLARSTIAPFFGIQVTNWTSDPMTDAQGVVVEGADAIDEPEAGFSEDLVRAWYILQGQPLVSHVLLVPHHGDPAEIEAAIRLLVDAERVGTERRREVKIAIAEATGLDRDRLTEAFATQRNSLTATDRSALMWFLQRGAPGSTYRVPTPFRIPLHGDVTD